MFMLSYRKFSDRKFSVYVSRWELWVIVLPPSWRPCTRGFQAFIKIVYLSKPSCVSIKGKPHKWRRGCVNCNRRREYLRLSA